MLTFLLLLLACGPSEPTRSRPTDPTALDARSDVDIDAFAPLQAQGVAVIDVRTPREFASGHVPGAVNVPIDQVEPKHPLIEKLPKDQPVYLICQSGRRSAQAADILASAGYRAVNVEGGTAAWKAAGHPVE